MAGGYRGGSTLIKTWPGPKSKPRAAGLIDREAKLAKTGQEPDGPLITPKAKPAKKQKLSPASKIHPSAPAQPIAASHPTAKKSVETTPLTPKARAKTAYTPDQVIGYLASHHPACPKKVRKRVGQIALENRWTNLTLDSLTLRCAEHYIVSDVCGVLRLIDCGIPASVANRLIEPQRKAVMTLWGF